MSGPHPLCTKCNDVLRPGFKLDNCQECKLHEAGPSIHKISYEEMSSILDSHPQNPIITEEDRFARRLKYLHALYSRGWTEDDWERAVIDEWFNPREPK